MLIPYLMLVLQTTLKTMQTVDMRKLDAYLQAVQNSIQVMQDELDGRFAKALTMLANSRDDMRADRHIKCAGITGPGGVWRGKSISLLISPGLLLLE